jgi:predicted GH43/DUF377 family glycosyl hydrolase
LTDLRFFNRQALYLRPDPARVVVRPFRPAVEPREANAIDTTRVHHIVTRVLALSEAEAEALLAATFDNFDDRHRNLPDVFAARAREIVDAAGDAGWISTTRRQLIGAYFLHEYSFEAAALFNPSIVLHHDQRGAPEGGWRFILSLRAVGEGHVSSLTFRTGTIAADGTVTVNQPAGLAAIPSVTARVGDRLELAFNPASDISERVIFPVTESQANGIEDARFVAFTDEGKTTFYATYTAYSGHAIRSELLETNDFLTFRLTPLRGPAARNKGMALFPRKIAGRYAMIARHDNESLHLIFSDDIYEWGLGTAIAGPRFPWEFVQIGNCGSPIELDEGWMLLTHGVGPVRHYAIGALLLDRDDPRRVIGRSREPLVQPAPCEREGYVPNVVYSCGAIRLGELIALPYAISDTFSTFATVRVAALVELLKAGIDTA